jgi:hypothetical protein
LAELAAFDAVGTTSQTSSNYSCLKSLLASLGNDDPDNFTGKFTLTPIRLDNQTNPCSLGYLTGTGLYACEGMNEGDVIGLNDDGSLPEAGIVDSATATSLTDDSKAWTPDGLIGKYVVLTDGTGTGQIRKITDNDAHSLTVFTWTTNPVATTPFRIVDKAYRESTGAAGLYSAGHIAALELEHTI